MHTLLLVTLALECRDTSLDARQSVYSQLLDDGSFCGDGGRFGHPISDWFVIGGRWSGVLRERLLGDGYQRQLKQRFSQFADKSYNPACLQECADGLDALWREFGGEGRSPFNRNDYAPLGGDDDALPVDRAIYDELLAEYQGERIGQDDRGRYAFVDLDDEDVDENFIGRKWIVAVDYHW